MNVGLEETNKRGIQDLTHVSELAEQLVVSNSTCRPAQEQQNVQRLQGSPFYEPRIHG